MQKSEAPNIEVSLPKGQDLEDLAIWVADAVDDWADRATGIHALEAVSARDIARALRVLGWMVGVAGSARRDVETEDSLTGSLLRAFDLLAPPPPDSGVRCKLTPFVPISLPEQDFDAEWEEATVVRRGIDLRAVLDLTRDRGDTDPEESTVVKKAIPRSTNRLLR